MSVKYVEYLYGDNNSYIDTGIVVQSGYQIEVTFMSTESKMSTQKNDWPGIFGVGNPIGYSYDTVPYGISAGFYGNRICVKNDGVNNYEYLNIDGTCYNQKYTLSLTAGENVTNPANLFLFAVNFTRDAGKSNPYSWGYSCLKIYDFKIYNAQGTLIQHLKPCLDDNNVPCMYDEVSGEYFENLGTGTFGYEGYHLYLFANNNNATAKNLGSYRLYNMKIEGDLEEVKADEINYIPYLQNDSENYIDTGISYNNETWGAVYKVQFDSINYWGTSPLSDDINNTCKNSLPAPMSGYSNYEITYNSNSKTRTRVTNWSLQPFNTTDIFEFDFNVTKENVTIVNGIECSTPTSAISSNGNMMLYWSPEKQYAKMKIYNFKLYKKGVLVRDFHPCLDTEGVPCMYDEVSKQYFHNQGSGTFGYKKKLRDFQPVLDSNSVPCLMDKINKKYYYDKNGKGFSCDRYSGVSYIKGDYNSYIDTGLIANEMHGYKIEIKFKRLTTYSIGNQLVFGSSNGGFDNASTNAHLRYNYYAYPQGLSCSDEDITAMYNPSVDTILDVDFTIDTPTSNVSFYLFAGNNHDTLLGTCDATIYYWKVYDTNNNLIQHLIPAIDTDGSIGMYDLVTETFFYNQGTGEFSYGIEEDECPPANYVEYIRGSRNAYINTLDISGMINSEVEVEWKFKLEAINKTTGWFGTVDEYNTFPIYAKNGYDSNLKANAIYVSFLNNGVTVKTEDRHIGVHVMKVNKTGLYMDGNLEVTMPEFTYKDTYRFVQPFALLGYNYWNGIQSRFPENILYYVTVKQAGELILDFRPCLDDNGVLCVYEAVNGIYYYNSDTGEFGGHGESIGYTPIKYIETNGTQYIDTGVVPTDNTDIDMVARAVGETPLYLMNGLTIDTTYKYNEIDTTVEPNLTASDGATLTLGSTYMAYLTEDEIEQAVDNGWTIQ